MYIFGSNHYVPFGEKDYFIVPEVISVEFHQKAPCNIYIYHNMLV